MLDGLAIRVAAFGGCAVVAYWLRHETFDMPAPYVYALLAALGLFALIEHLAPPLPAKLARQWLGRLGRLLLVVFILTALGYLLKISDLYSRLWAIYWLLMAWGVLGLLDTVIARSMRPRRLILVGDPMAVQRHRAAMGCVQGAEVVSLSLSDCFEWLRGLQEGEASRNRDELRLVGRFPDESERTALILALHGNPINLSYCLDVEGSLSGGEQVTVPLLAPLGGLDAAVKRSEDVLLGALALALLSPLMFVLAVLVRLDGPGPVLFRQRRLGMGGRAFTILKFRTMVPQAAGDADAQQAVAGDMRVTQVGAVLRRWGLDELPQLFNVLSGDMSLVGPRPHAFPHDVLWGSQVAQYAQRFRVRPGLTGMAQIRGLRGYAETINDIEERVALDLEYIRNWSLLLDAKMLWETIPALVRGALRPS